MTAQDIIDEASKKPEFKKQELNVKVSKKDLDAIKKSEEKKLEKVKEEEKEKPVEISVPKPKKPKKKRKPIFDEEDKTFIKTFGTHVITYGLLINFAVFSIFKLPFSYYSWLGWGIGYWFVEERLIPLIKTLLIKKT